MQMAPQTILWTVFASIIVGFLIVDLGYFNRKAHKVSIRSALIQSLFWICISFAFAALVWKLSGATAATEFVSAYLTEKMLSVDNLFVILLIFSFFKLEEQYHHRVLFWGILGAVVFRGIFIGVGSVVVHEFHALLYLFGALLIYTGLKLLRDKKEEHIDFHKNKVVVWARRYLPFTENHHHGKFVIREQGKVMFTVLFMIILLVEATDLIFAVDSIPAAFAISQSSFIIFTSNIFAIMGLRALFFLIENIVHRFHHLQKGLSFILIFIGLKMLLDIVDVHLSSVASFAVILGALGLSIVLSIAFPKRI